MKNRLYHEDLVCRDYRIHRIQDTCKAFMLCSSKFGFGQSKVWIWLGNTATQLFSAVSKHNFCSLAYRHMLPKHTFYQADRTCHKSDFDISVTDLHVFWPTCIGRFHLCSNNFHPSAPFFGDAKHQSTAFNVVANLHVANVHVTRCQETADVPPSP